MASRQGDRNSLLGVVTGLGWPLIIGAALTSVFYALILRGPLQSELTQRYFAGHPVNVCEVVLFFIALAALALKLGDVAIQSVAGRRIGLGEDAAELTVADCRAQLARLAALPAALRNTYLARRLRAALEHVQRSGSADGLDEELKYLADLDVARQQDSFSLVRIIIWATPMLGFLGTVIGITRSLGELDPQLLATDPKTAMQGLLSGLFVAFDTTAEALALSMTLMFIQFFTERFESELLYEVDRRAEEELLGRFEQAAHVADPQLAAVQRMGNAVLKAAQQLVQDQTEHWRQTIDAVNSQWKDLLETSSRSVQNALAASLDSSLKTFSEHMSALERDADERVRNRWEQWQTALSDNARLLHSQQAELVRQGDVMTQVLQATGDVIKLEQALNDNLRGLAGARHFEETVMSLSAAIHLLNARLGDATAPPGSLELGKSHRQGRAA